VIDCAEFEQRQAKGANDAYKSRKGELSITETLQSWPSANPINPDSDNQYHINHVSKFLILYEK